MASERVARHELARTLPHWGPQGEILVENECTKTNDSA